MNPSSPAGAAQPNNIFKPVNLTGGQGSATLDQFTSPQVVGVARQPVQPVATASRPYPVENLESTETSALDNPVNSEQSLTSQPEFSSINNQNQPVLNNNTPASSSQNVGLGSQNQGPKVTLKKIIAIIIVILLLGTAGYFIWRSRQAQQLTGSDFTDQTVELGPESSGLEDLGLESEEEKLIVQGDLITQGDVYISTNSNLGILAQITGNLTENRTFILPDVSGTFCLDANNCNFVLEEDFITTTINGFVDTVTIQGTTNQITVSNAGNTITLSTPQNIGTTSSPSFNSIILAVAGTQDGNEICDISNNCGYAGTNAFIQDGNSFGATAVLGTNDANSLSFETSGATQVTIAVGGATTFQNSSDSTSGFRIMDADGGDPVLNIDTTNERVGIGVSSDSPAATLQVATNNTSDSTTSINQYNLMTVNPSGNQACGFLPCNINNWNEIETSGSNDLAFTYGSINAIDHSNATGNISDAIALLGAFDNFGTGTAGSVTAIRAGIDGNSTDITQAIGLDVGVAGYATQTAYGIRVGGINGVGTAGYGVAVDTADTQTLWLQGDEGTANSGIGFGSAIDTNLYRSAAGELTTDDDLVVGSQLAVGSTASITANQTVTVQETITATSGNIVGVNTELNVSAAGASTAAIVGNSGVVNIESGNIQDYESTIGSYGESDHNGTGSLNTSVGLGGFTYNSNSGVIGSGAGTYGAVINSSNGSITDANGVVSIVWNSGSGTISNAYGTHVLSILNTGGGTIDTSMGLKIDGQSGATNSYGIVIDEASTQSLWLSGNDGGSNTGIAFGTSLDTNLYRSAADTLSTDDAFTVGGTLTTTTLGSADTATYLCRNSSNQVASCNTTGTGASFIQGGNTFGATATLGTNDANDLVFETNNTARITIDASTGNTNFQNNISVGGDIRAFSSSTEKMSEPASLPASHGNGVDFSPNGQYLVDVHETTPFMTIYELGVSDDTFTKLSDPASLPASTGRGVGFSPNGQYVAVAHDTTPFVTIYEVDYDTDTFTKLSDPASLPAGNAQGVRFSADGQYMAVAHSTTPFVTIYEVDYENDTFTKLSDPASLPASTGRAVAFSPSGQYMSVAHSTTPFITIYEIDPDTDTFTKIADPASLPSSAGFSTVFSPNNQYMAVGNDAANYLTIYEIDPATDTFTKIADPASLPTGKAWAVDFSPDGQFLAVGHTTSPRITIYEIDADTDTFTKIADASDSLNGNGRGVDFSPDGRFLAVSQVSTPFLSLYTGISGTADAHGVIELAISTDRFGGISLGRDLQLFRSAAGSLVIQGTSDSSATLAIKNSAGDNVLTVDTVKDALVFGDDTNLYRSAVDTLKTDDSFEVTGDLGIGVTPGTYKLDVADDASATYVANFFNDGNNADRYGIQIQAGADDGSGTTYYLNALDGDGTQVGYIANTSGTFALTDISDIRTKTNVQDTANDASSILAGLRVVDFNRLQDPDGPTITGFIAQEVQQVYSQAVTTSSGGLLGVQKDAFIPLLVKGHQDQQLSLQSLDSRLAVLEAGQPQTTSTDLSLESLSVSDATELSTLKVSGATSLSSLTVKGNATFIGDITVKGNLRLEGKILGNQHTRGTITIEEGATEVEFIFDKPFSEAPNIVLTATNAFTPSYRVETSKTKFTLYLKEPATVDTIFNYQVQQ